MLKSIFTLENTAVFFGLISVWYSKKEHIYVYPTGIVSVGIYIYLCYVGGLYAESAINLYYFIMSLYGWWQWQRGGAAADTALIITKNTVRKNFILIGICVIIWAVMAGILIFFTDSTVPYIDALATAIFAVGMWLMAQKKIENWLYWIAGDLICIPLYAHKGYVATAVQYTIFTILAVAGYAAWRKKMAVAG